eukprot:IDg10594t1
MPAVATYSDAKMSYERNFLLQKYLFLLLRDIIQASSFGVLIDGVLHCLRLNTLVCDQPQERSFLSLRAVGSFMDCSICLMTSLRFKKDISIHKDHVPDELLMLPSDNDVHVIQTSPENAVPRSVINIVSHQLVVSKSSSCSDEGSHEFTRDEFLLSKRYLRRVSANHIPPALGALYGLSSPPYRLYQSVEFDKLHVYDLGAARILPDFSFKKLSQHSYNKGKLSKSTL